ncbi:hypothetical protein HYALB_00012433 [Hymenoscyphus albidus]|uniref:2EXR domain-containing protein n=1 Tax=Hymenoscyphus albidus TaxID=595503 RepID=A0A9N9LNR7_9HELO|nr:hypothetical protein HYALB_00012433 [Hymenoscyphus albidus]
MRPRKLFSLICHFVPILALSDGCPKNEVACLDVMNSSQCIEQLILEGSAPVTKEALVKCVVNEGSASDLPGETKLYSPPFCRQLQDNTTLCTNSSTTCAMSEYAVTILTPRHIWLSSSLKLCPQFLKHNPQHTFQNWCQTTSNQQPATMPSKRDIVKNNPMTGLRDFLPRLKSFEPSILTTYQKEAVAGLLRPFSNNGTLAAGLRLSNDHLQARTVNLEHARPLLERVLTYKATTKGYSLELKIWNDAIGLVNKEYDENHPNENQEPLFPRFGSLPLEPRMMVWRYAALDSCLIATTKIYVHQPFPMFPPRSTYRLFACNIPALFLVNRESRAEAVKANPGFVLNGSFGIDGMLRVAPTQAIIHLKPSVIRRYTDDDGMVKDFADSLTGSEKAKIENIAIDLDADHQGTVVGELMGFPMLENVVVVLMHKGLRPRGFRSKDELVRDMEHKVTQTFGLIKAWDTTWNVPSFQVLYLGNEHLDGSYDPDESSKFLSNYWSTRKG